ncbi:glycoside hydrolase family 9 protein [Neptunicella marina]|uniref:Glycoside hydrolase family 9 protein n=1 Tax=Neptunicella marina TaxID=2125989 RepID=A0A8J6ISM7_9ALTE|nr:glycoside hydrolase family 9 protein [Neptunicella marina]MBC3764853.1 glycoside hydrolase family 9 protein [Neptunicella marina]
MTVRMLPLLRNVIIGISTLASTLSVADDFSLTDKQYFHKDGADVLAFSNWYNGLFSDSKISGVEVIQQGERTVTNGDIRIHATPEQWDLIPAFIRREVNGNSIESFMHYSDFNFNYSIKVSQANNGKLNITVNLPKAVPQALAGKAGFNLEFLPAAYFEKAFITESQNGQFPLYPSGNKEQNGKVAPALLASGHQLTLAPADPKHRIQITSSETISLYDGRSKAQNGWFVARSLLPTGKTGEVLKWQLDVTGQPNWQREPVIAHSQVGYHPKQKKVAVVELDSTVSTYQEITLLKVSASGDKQKVVEQTPSKWGNYTRYQYAKFDFSNVTEPGLYQLQYGDTLTAPFRIASDIFSNVWHPTLDMYMPIQMDHMLINEAYRVWHGASHLDDALQAPANHEHFDLYAMGPTTDTQFKAGEHIPGLNIGGWYDAGDYDIRTQTQYGTVLDLVHSWEQFSPERDSTTVDYSRKYVDLHVPDGKPDLLQQIEHGTLALIAQFRAVGHAIHGIIVPDISQYTHLGDGLTMTDNLIYDSSMSELETDGFHSGKFDDRWAFTTKSSALNYGSLAALSAASRALKGYNNKLAKECIDTAIKVWQDEQSHAPNTYHYGNTTGGPLYAEKLKAATELLISTGDSQYQQAIRDSLPDIKAHFDYLAIWALRAIPLMDNGFKQQIRELVKTNQTQRKELDKANPFGVVITEGGWAGNGTVMRQAITSYYMHQVFPDLVDTDQVMRGLNYLFGTHPDSDISFVSAVGAKSKKVAYGMNRADFSFIPGGIVPGVLILKPDFPENKENWPFFWGQNEYVVNMGASYIFLAHAAQHLLDTDPAYKN